MKKTILTIIISLSISTGISAPATEKYADAAAASAQTNAQKYADAMLGDYAKRDEIPTVPTKVGELENDKGYVTEAQVKPSEHTPGYAKFADWAGNAEYANVSDFAYGVDWSQVQNPPDGLGTIALRVDDLERTVDAHAATKQDRPVATVAATEISYRADGGTISVAVADGGTLSATISGWTDGQAQTAIISLASGATVADGISLVGYGSWPTGRFIASCIRVGPRIYVTPITYVAAEEE